MIGQLQRHPGCWPLAACDGGEVCCAGLVRAEAGDARGEIPPGHRAGYKPRNGVCAMRVGQELEMPWKLAQSHETWSSRCGYPGYMSAAVSWCGPRAAAVSLARLKKNTVMRNPKPMKRRENKKATLMP